MVQFLIITNYTNSIINTNPRQNRLLVCSSHNNIIVDLFVMVFKNERDLERF